MQYVWIRIKNRTLITQALLFIAVVGLCSCSLKSNTQGASLRVPLPGGQYTFLDAITLAYASVTTPWNLSTAPSTLTDFDCFAVNVSGPGIDPDSRVSCTDPSDSPAIIGGFVNRGNNSIDLTVPNGSARRVQVFGVRSIVGCPDLNSMLNGGSIQFDHNIGHFYRLGETTLDLFNDDTATIHVSYTASAPTQVFNSCHRTGEQPGGAPIWNAYQTNAPGTVRATKVLNNTLYLGGTFNYLGPATASVAMTDNNGAILQGNNAAKVGLFNPSTTATCSTSDGAGGFFFGGDFLVGSSATHTYLLHLLPDGSLDPGWVLAPNGVVSACVVANNTLFIGGSFTTVTWGTGAPQTRNSLAMVDLSSHSLLDFGASNPSFTAGTHPVATLAATPLSGSSFSLYVGGDFTTSNLTRQSFGANLNITLNGSGQIAALASGSWNPSTNASITTVAQILLDSANSTAFVLSTAGLVYELNLTNGAGSLIGTPTGGTPIIHSIALDSTHQYLYVGGSFTAITGAGSPTGLHGLARYLYNTPIWDTAWAPSLSTSASITTMALDPTAATLYFGGTFTTVNADVRTNLAALNVASPGGATVWGPHTSGPVNILQYDPVLGHIFVCGAFSSLGGFPRRNLAAIDLAAGEGLMWDPQPNGPVYAIETDGSKIFVGGSFSSVGQATTQSIAALDPVSGIADYWASNSGTNVGGTVYALAAQAGSLYIAGNFTSMGGNSLKSAAALNISNGNVIPTWNPNVQYTTTQGTVNTLALAGSQVYLGGLFDHVNGVAKNNLALIDTSTGSVNTAFSGQTSAGVYTLALNGSSLFVGGIFASINGINHTNLAVVDSATGTTDLTPASWPIPSGINQINTLMIGNNLLYVGGSNPSSATAAFAYDLSQAGYPLAAWNADIEGTGTPSTASVYSISLGASALYLGGNFQQVNGPAVGIGSKFSPAIGAFDPNTGVAL